TVCIMIIVYQIFFLIEFEIVDIDVEDISVLFIIYLDYGKKLDLTMKLICFANRHDQQVEVSVQPTFLSNKHPLAAVKNEYNAVYVKAESVGETMFYGAGAGGLPTATAIMSDVVETIKNTLL